MKITYNLEAGYLLTRISLQCTGNGWIRAGAFKENSSCSSRLSIECVIFHTRIQKALPEGVQHFFYLVRFFLLFFFFFFFFFDKGIEDPNSTKSGSSSAHSETPFKWRFAGGPMMTQH